MPSIYCLISIIIVAFANVRIAFAWSDTLPIDFERSIRDDDIDRIVDYISNRIGFRYRRGVSYPNAILSETNQELNEILKSAKQISIMKKSRHFSKYYHDNLVKIFGEYMQQMMVKGHKVGLATTTI
jgi:predicted component of viral defense system (DUF524 family)